MKAEDFEGIEPGDVVQFVYLDEWIYGSIIMWRDETPNICATLTIKKDGKYFDVPVEKTSDFSVLTGKLAPWSIPFVPDDALWCVQSILYGIISFYYREDEGMIKDYLEQPEYFIVTKRPAWRKKNGE